MNQKLKCIMLIDDDEPTNFISNMLLEETNCAGHIQIEESAKTALEYLARAGGTTNETGDLLYPDLIFLDINMPAMNGWEFLDKYKELKTAHHPKTIIIMLTTSNNPEDKSRAESIPLVTAFENKPITVGMIQRVIKKYFSDCNETEVDQKSQAM